MGWYAGRSGRLADCKLDERYCASLFLLRRMGGILPGDLHPHTESESDGGTIQREIPVRRAADATGRHDDVRRHLHMAVVPR